MRSPIGARCFAAFLLASGCSGSSTAPSTGGSTGTGAGGTGGATIPASTGTGGTPTVDGAQATADVGPAGGTLPCGVQTLFASRCIICHGSIPAPGPRSLVTFADLIKPEPANPSLNEAQVSLQRMKSPTASMPPSPAPPPTAAEIAILQNWINADYPSGSCSSADAGVDTGVDPSDPLKAQPTCTSKATWTLGNAGSAAMKPGQICMGCHTAGNGEVPVFHIAGTLYPTGHEPNDCDGVYGPTSGAKLVVTGANGVNVTVVPNLAGNFYSLVSLPLPYKAKVVASAGEERVMMSSISTGDCNTCHTQTGINGAPGRVTVP